MKVYELKNDEGELIAFEVSNFLLTRSSFVKKLKKIDGVLAEDDFKPVSDGEFFQFKYSNETYYVDEPWGDSSRYWIGPRELMKKKMLSQLMTFVKKIK